jgi:hypothetical protein
MPRGLNRDDYAVLCNLLARLSDDEMSKAMNTRLCIRAGMKKGKKAAKAKAPATT